MSLFEDLKRRNVLRVGSAYALAGWVVLQVADILIPALLLPEWVLTALVAALVIGFPIALLLSWNFEITPDGVKAEADIDRAGAGGTAPRPGRRKLDYVIIGSLVLAVAFLLVDRFAITERDAAAAAREVSEDVFAVLPFTVRGSVDLEYLGEGLVDLISDKLDGAGSFQSIDPRSVIGSANDQRLDLMDPAAGAALARTLGAGRFVTGEVLETGARVRLSAELRDSSAPTEPLETATVEGSVDELLTLVDKLAADLLAESLDGPNARLQAIATRTSASIEATKEFLYGERMHREGRYREASAAYARAIEIDSTFALAYYKRSVVNDYNDEPDDFASAEMAVRYSGDLSQRDQTLMRALLEQRAGHRRVAEEMYRTHVLRYPDEVGALMQLGEILFHDNPRRGRPMGESREWFERVVELEPGNIEANLHLMRLDTAEGRLDALASRAAFFREVAPGSERAIEADAAYAFTVGDTARQRAIMAELDTLPWYFRAYAAMSVARARDPVSVAGILAVRRPGFDYLDSRAILFDVARGNVGSARELLSDVDRRRNASWETYAAFLLESELFEFDPALAESVLGRLRNVDPVELKESAFVPLHDIVTPRVAEFERDWHVGMVLGVLGRFEEAWEIQRRLADVGELPAMGSVPEDAARALAAEILYRSGDRRGALDLLRQQRYEQPGAVMWLSFADATRARFLRAELEMELGDPLAAKPFYDGFHGSYSAFDQLYAGVAYERLGRIAELEDDLEGAIFNYTKLLEFWREADPGFVPLREDVRARLDELLVRVGREPRGAPATGSDPE